MTATRIESDSLGEIKVPADKYYGAQTARSIINFAIGEEKMPQSVIESFAILKQAAAATNCELGKLTEEKRDLISKAAQEIIDGKLDNNFPLSVWQTGSGTQTNMNVNEVIANRAIEIAGGTIGSKAPIHPNNDVNMSQSSNDTFPSAMYMAAAIATKNELLPQLKSLLQEMRGKEQVFNNIIKVGRTHLQDATPLSLAQEFSGHSAQLEHAITSIEKSLPGLYNLAIGGTAVGTGLNTHPKFARNVAAKIAEKTKIPFRSHPNKFAALAAHDELVSAGSSLKVLAVALLKIANDIRWLASGPRSGIAELILPANEPGSSIMPGKVNPTQCEALTMVAVQVMANDQAITFAGSQGNFQLNVYKPIMIYNYLQSIKLLSDAMASFKKNALQGLCANEKNIAKNLNNSLMLVTALNEILGYDNCAKIAKYAYEHDISLKEACITLKLLNAAEFEQHIDPSKMISPSE